MRGVRLLRESRYANLGGITHASSKVNPVTRPYPITEDPKPSPSRGWRRRSRLRESAPTPVAAPVGWGIGILLMAAIIAGLGWSTPSGLDSQTVWLGVVDSFGEAHLARFKGPTSIPSLFLTSQGATHAIGPVSVAGLSRTNTRAGDRIRAVVLPATDGAPAFPLRVEVNGTLLYARSDWSSYIASRRDNAWLLASVLALLGTGLLVVGLGLQWRMRAA